MTVMYNNITISCTPEEFKRMIELGIFKKEDPIVLDVPNVPNESNDFPPYLNYPKK